LNPTGGMDVCYVLSGRGLCEEMITRPEESYRLWCVVVYDLETPRMWRPWPSGGCRAKNKQNDATIKPRVYKFCKNVPATTTFWEPERWHEERFSCWGHTNVRRHYTKFSRLGIFGLLDKAMTMGL